MNDNQLYRVIATKKAVIFDLFHTLTSLESTWGDGRPTTSQMLGIDKEAWELQLNKNSRARLTGEQTDPYAMVAEMARAIDPTIGDEAIRAATENRIQRFAAALTGIPEETGRVLRVLKESGKRIGLVSNADVMEVAAWRQCPVAGLFDSTVFSCSAGCVKPEPAIYRASMAHLGVEPEDSMFVGDGGSDELQGARNLGITTVMITGIIQEIWPERIPDRKRYADFVIEHLGELVVEPN